MSQYGRAQYWEERYTKDSEPFDWYQRYYHLRDIIDLHIPVESRILNVGAGTSSNFICIQGFRRRCSTMATKK